VVLERIVSATCQVATFEHRPQPQVIDERRLAGMTIGDPRLEREVLDLFLSRAAAMLERAGTAPATSAGAAADRLKGSAHAIGAWRLARAAESFEQAVANAEETQIREALSELRAAALEASAVIVARLDRSSTGRGLER
jgi:HPt (histidine-containing phosphotransfer) domain-containing protein